MAGVPLDEHARTAPRTRSGAGGPGAMSLPRRPARRLLRRRLHRLGRGDGGADLRRAADGALPRHADARRSWRGSASYAASASPAWRGRGARPGWTRIFPRRSRRSRGSTRRSRTTRCARPSIPRPQVGSIGRAIDLAARGARRRLACRSWSRRRRSGATSSSATSSPRSDGVGHRLDRHPMMARHPVTPMDEADVPRHLARADRAQIGLVD